MDRLAKNEASSRSEHPDLRVRDCTYDDYQAIADIYTESIQAGTVTFDTHSPTAEDIDNQIEGFNDREAILVLERETDVIGWAIIKRYSDRTGYRVCCEKSVYLRMSETGRGYGSLLQRAVLDRCRHYGYHHIVSKIVAANQGSIEFNRRFGFEVVGVQKEVGYLEGTWLDVVIMQLVLEDVPPYRPELG